MQPHVQMELMLKTPQEMHVQTTERIAIEHELRRILKEIMENPKK